MDKLDKAMRDFWVIPKPRRTSGHFFGLHMKTKEERREEQSKRRKALKERGSTSLYRIKHAGGTTVKGRQRARNTSSFFTRLIRGRSRRRSWL